MATESKQEVIPLTEAAAYIPSRPHWATVVRWALRGLLVDGGTRVKLATTKIGGRRFTTEADIERFIATLTSAREVRATALQTRATQMRQADADLDKEGIC